MKKNWFCILFFLCYVHLGHGKDSKGASLPASGDGSASSLELYSESYVLNSFASQLYIHKGIYTMKEGKFELAISNFQQALKLNPGSFEAYSLLGEVMVAMDLKSEAINAFDKAIDLNPFYANAYFQRANLLQAIGNYKQAYSDYTIAMYIDPIYILAFQETNIDLLTFKKALQNELNVLRK